LERKGRSYAFISEKKITMEEAYKLYVGGIPYETSEDALKDAFSQAGTVTSAVIITDRETGRSRGFGFIEMTSDEELQKAIEMFDGKELEGRKLTVNKARPPKEKKEW
jgi:cold-inducible RNA-binding protein